MAKSARKSVASKSAASRKAPVASTRVQPRPVVNPGNTALTVENQEAADREVASRQRLSDEARAKNSDKTKAEMDKAPGKPFIPARNALNKLDEEIRKIRDTDREHWKPSEMRRFRDEAIAVARRVEDMVTGDAD